MPDPISTIEARIISDPAIHGGEPIIEGTSTPVRAVAELWNQGMPAEEVPVHLPHLHLAQVFEALRYYLTHREGIDKHIEANRVADGWSGKRFDPVKGRVE
jgi:uncharacterized protein (DUF433 family)